MSRAREGGRSTSPRVSSRSTSSSAWSYDPAMRILFAGATGVLGRATLPHLGAHDIVGLTRSAEKVPLLQELGAEALVCDIRIHGREQPRPPRKRPEPRRRRRGERRLHCRARSPRSRGAARADRPSVFRRGPDPPLRPAWGPDTFHDRRSRPRYTFARQVPRPRDCSPTRRPVPTSSARRRCAQARHPVSNRVGERDGVSTHAFSAWHIGQRPGGAARRMP